MHATNPHGACTPLAARCSRLAQGSCGLTVLKARTPQVFAPLAGEPPSALANFMVRSWASLCDMRTSLLMDSRSATRGVPRNFLTSGPPRLNLLRWAAAGCPPGLQKRPHPRRSPTPPTSLDQMRCRKVAAVRNCRPCARGPEGQMILFIGPAGPEQSFGRPNFLSAGEEAGAIRFLSIYNRRTHLLTADQSAQMLTGQQHRILIVTFQCDDQNSV